MLYAPSICNLNIFFNEFFFNGSGHGLFGLSRDNLKKKIGLGQPIFASSQKVQVRVKYFSGRINKF